MTLTNKQKEHIRWFVTSEIYPENLHSLDSYDELCEQDIEYRDINPEVMEYVHELRERINKLFNYPQAQFSAFSSQEADANPSPRSTKPN